MDISWVRKFLLGLLKRIDYNILKKTYIYYFRENITAVENRIAHANKRIVEAEFKLQKLKEECIKEQVKSDIIFYD